MLVICEDCGKKYNIDESRIKARRARFTCNECGHIIIIDKADLSRPLISKKNPGFPPSSPVDLLLEMEGRAESAAFSGSKEEIDVAPEEDASDPPRQLVRRKNRGIPLFVFFAVTVLLAFLCVGLMAYLYAGYISGGSDPQSIILIKSMLIFGVGWLVTFLFFSVFAHNTLQKFNRLIKYANQLGAGTYDIAFGSKGPREIRDLAFALDRIRQRLETTRRD